VGQVGVFIIDKNNKMKEKKGSQWIAVPGGDNVVDISVGRQKVWVVKKTCSDKNQFGAAKVGCHKIYRWKSSWEKMPGDLIDVRVNPTNDDVAWGHNSFGGIGYKYVNGGWHLKGGMMRQFTVDVNGNVWAIGLFNKLHSYGIGGTAGWNRVNSWRDWSWISAGRDGEVWAVDENSKVFRKGSGGAADFKEIKGKKLWQVDVWDGTVWGVDGDSQIWYRSTTD